MDGERRCGQCSHWEYNEWIERKYGEGTGLCDGVEPKGCDRVACLCFEKRDTADVRD